MRVLHVIAEMAAGGAERVVISLANGSTHESAVASASGALSDLLRCPRFELPVVRRHPARLVRAAFMLRTVVATWKPTLVHCHNPGMALVTRLALLGRDTPAIVSVHGLVEADYPTACRLMRAIKLPVVACGAGVAEALRRHGLAPRATVPNGIPAPPPPADRAMLASDLGIPADRPLVVTAGRLVALKNVDVVVAAMGAVPGAVLAVVGDGPERAGLEEVARANRVGDRVVFTGHRADARSIIGAAQVVVLASSSEGMPLVALEALAAGTPLVATSIPGVRDVVADGRTGLLVPPRDVAATATAIHRVLMDPALAARLSAEGRRTAEGFTEEAMIAAFEQLYERAAAR